MFPGENKVARSHARRQLEKTAREMNRELAGLRSDMKREVGVMKKKKEEDELTVHQTGGLRRCCLHSASGHRPSKRCHAQRSTFF